MRHLVDYSHCAAGLKVSVCAVDNSAEVLNVAKEAVYTSQLCDLVGESIFERMTEGEFEEMFESDGRAARVRSRIREGTSWHLGDAGDPGPDVRYRTSGLGGGE